MSKENIASSVIMFCLAKKKLFRCHFENRFRIIQKSNSGKVDDTQYPREREIEMKKDKENDIKAVKKGNLSCLRQEFED